MRKKLIALLVPMTLILALVVYAQTRSSSMGSEKGNKTTLTGCLQTGSEPNTYMLNNVSMSRNRSGSTPSEMARAETSYKLIPEGSVDLKDHVGHKVEVTGMLEHAEMSMEHSTSGESSSSYSNKSSEVPEIKVSSIRHISATCP